jgi:putative FmdB family regulatory protein
MPVYQYICTGCNKEFELRQSFHDESIVECPDCNCVARRIFSVTPVIFKGSGFYSTDRNKSGNSGGGINKSDIQKLGKSFES